MWWKHRSPQLHLHKKWALKSNLGGLMGEGRVRPQASLGGAAPLCQRRGQFSGGSCSSSKLELLYSEPLGEGTLATGTLWGASSLSCWVEMIDHQVLNPQLEQIFQDQALSLSALQNLLSGTWLCSDGIFYPVLRCLHRVYLRGCISEGTLG